MTEMTLPGFVITLPNGQPFYGYGQRISLFTTCGDASKVAATFNRMPEGRSLGPFSVGAAVLTIRPAEMSPDKTNSQSMEKPA